MRKLIITHNHYLSLLLLLYVSFSYSCAKGDEEVRPSIVSGRLVNAGDHSTIRVNPSFGAPIIQIFRANSISFQFEEVDRISVANDGQFSKRIDFNKYIYENNDTRYDWSVGHLLFFYGITHYDTSLYVPVVNNFSVYYGRWAPGINTIKPGVDLSVEIPIEAKAWVRFHIINKNTASDADKDILYLFRGGFTEVSGGAPYIYFYGKVDTLCNFIRRTHSGNRNHSVAGRLIRRGKKIWFGSPYTLMPFDTTLVEVEY